MGRSPTRRTGGPDVRDREQRSRHDAGEDGEAVPFAGPHAYRGPGSPADLVTPHSRDDDGHWTLEGHGRRSAACRRTRYLGCLSLLLTRNRPGTSRPPCCSSGPLRPGLEERKELATAPAQHTQTCCISPLRADARKTSEIAGGRWRDPRDDPRDAAAAIRRSPSFADHTWFRLGVTDVVTLPTLKREFVALAATLQEMSLPAATWPQGPVMNDDALEIHRRAFRWSSPQTEPTRVSRHSMGCP